MSSNKLTGSIQSRGFIRPIHLTSFPRSLPRISSIRIALRPYTSIRLLYFLSPNHPRERWGTSDGTQSPIALYEARGHRRQYALGAWIPYARCSTKRPPMPYLADTQETTGERTEVQSEGAHRGWLKVARWRLRSRWPPSRRWLRSLWSHRSRWWSRSRSPPSRWRLDLGNNGTGGD